MAIGQLRGGHAPPTPISFPPRWRNCRKAAQVTLTVGTVMRRAASFVSLATMRVAGFQMHGDAKRKRLPIILAHILGKRLYESCPTPA